MTDVQVKPLEWRGSDPDYTNADCILGRIEIINTFHDSGFMVQMAGTTRAIFRPTMDDAKAAAQADYEARIRSALVPAPAVPDDVAQQVERLRKAYALVAEFPESKPDGFMNLLALRNLTPDAADTIEAQAAELARLREALEFYADQNHLRLPSEGPWGVNSTDFGKVAREALK